MGRTARYRMVFGYKKNAASEPWFIPGLGPKNSPFGFTYTVGYRFSFGKKRELTKEELSAIE